MELYDTLALWLHKGINEFWHGELVQPSPTGWELTQAGPPPFFDKLHLPQKPAQEGHTRRRSRHRKPLDKAFFVQGKVCVIWTTLPTTKCANAMSRSGEHPSPWGARHKHQIF